MSNFDLIQNHSNTENCQQCSSIEQKDDRYVSQDHTHFHLCILLRHLVRDLDMLCTQVCIYSNAYENFKNKIYFFIISKVKVFFYILQQFKNHPDDLPAWFIDTNGIWGTFLKFWSWTFINISLTLGSLEAIGTCTLIRPNTGASIFTARRTNSWKYIFRYICNT